ETNPSPLLLIGNERPININKRLKCSFPTGKERGKGIGKFEKKHLNESATAFVAAVLKAQAQSQPLSIPYTDYPDLLQALSIGKVSIGVPIIWKRFPTLLT